MSQVDLPTSIGYAVKRTAVALRSAMETELRECGLSVTQYSVLELLVQRSGLSNAELARGVFVTRQATHQLLAGMQDAALIELEGGGRRQRVLVTAAGRTLLTEASGRVAAIERRMLTDLTADQQAALLRGLNACTAALDPAALDPAALDPAALDSSAIDPAGADGPPGGG
jgi:DNA-binding MarR family transcriptional regulator